MSTNTPLISIITPCFNSALFIRECLDSVLAQDHPPVEHIVQDGASTDGTAEIIQEYAKKYPDRIKFVSEADRGQSDGLNRALQRSSGDIFLVLNADDALLPGACAWGVTTLRQYPEAAAVYGDEYIIDETSKVIEKFYAQPYDFKKLLCLELVPPAQASFIRRQAMEQAGFYADNTLDSCPDFEMWVRLGLKFPIVYVPGFVSRYRKLTGKLFEGGIPKTADRFYHAKRLVQRRVLASPRTPLEIRQLADRAETGLLLWSAAAYSGLIGDWRGIIINGYLWKAIWFGIKTGQLTFWRHSFNYLKISVKRILYGRH